MIRLVEALNYRCLAYISQPLSPFHVLVGPNASGKSTFLDVLGLIRDFLTLGLDDAILTRGGRSGRASRVEELFFHQQGDRFEVAVELPVPDSLFDKTRNGQHRVARYEIALGKADRSDELAIIEESLWLCPKPQTRQARHSPTLFPVEPARPNSIMTKRADRGWKKIIAKTKRGNDHFYSERGNWTSSFRIGPRRAALSNLPEDHDRFPIALWTRNVLMEGIRVLALNTAAMRRPSSPSTSRSFRVDGSNLPLVLREFRNDHPTEFRDWLEHIRTVLPDIETVDVVERAEDRNLYLAMRSARLKNPIPSWLLSDGTLRLLALTLLAYLPHNREIYAIEEAENGVHPRAIEGVFESLSSVYDGQILIATHSPLIVGLAKPEQILCFEKNPSGATSIVLGREHPKLRDWLGTIDIGTLYAAGVLG